MQTFITPTTFSQSVIPNSFSTTYAGITNSAAQLPNSFVAQEAAPHVAQGLFQMGSNIVASLERLGSQIVASLAQSLTSATASAGESICSTMPSMQNGATTTTAPQEGNNSWLNSFLSVFGEAVDYIDSGRNIWNTAKEYLPVIANFLKSPISSIGSLVGGFLR